MPNIEILGSQTICAQPGRYIGWPTVASAPDGSVYAVFSGDRDAHVCPFGKVFFLRSLDRGITWSEPEVIANTPLDDRDAGVCVCPDGTIVVSWFASHFGDYAWQYKVEYVRCYPDAEDRWPAWEKYLAGVTPDMIARWAPSYESPKEGDFLKRRMGFWTIRSRDGGKTWDVPALSPVYAPHGPAVLANGDLFFVGMRHLARPQGENTIGAARSRDQGLTWEVLATIPGFPPYPGKVPNGLARLGEPHVVETRSGKLIGMARYEQTKNPDEPFRSHLWQFDSTDGGRTWTEPRKTVIVGKPPALSLCRNGDLLVSYGHRDIPRRHCACVSRDEGVSWDYANEIIFHEPPVSDFGYASTTETAEDEFLSVYYEKESADTKTVLGATHWKRALKA